MFFVVALCVAQDVFRHHNPRIDKHADRNRDPAE